MYTLNYGQLLLALILFLSACQSPTSMKYESFSDYPIYKGTDLGLTYKPELSTFRIWAPTASTVTLRMYDEGNGGQATETFVMERSDQGTWIAEVRGNQLGKFYSFQTVVGEKTLAEVPDPYAKAVGVNGNRAMVVDLDQTNPLGWAQDRSPVLKEFTDIIIYEVHVRDLSMHSNSGIQNKGKFLGFTELGTQSPSGEPTGLDHIKSLGVTHVHLLPSYDYLSVDESKPEDNEFNWGYDPQNYNVPEGSYSTNPADGNVRIREFKQLIKTLHEHGLRVILDVVYNHTGKTEDSNFNQLVPGYYYRQDSLGGFSNASACGNETASDRTMMRKFMVESVKHWVNEYHIDGFRFDLMGIHDIETMNEISKALHAIDPTIFIYGEGWTAGDSPLPYENRALKAHGSRLNDIAVFSDDIRDGLKGSVFNHEEQGFVSGRANMEETVKFGIVASTEHPQIDYAKINYSNAPYSKSPTQTITYVSCHDNHTLWDKLAISNAEESEAERIRIHKLATTIVLTSQGVPFLHAGVELARTKQGVENSFESPDSINQIDWSRKTTHKAVFEYVQGLIQLRKNHPAFRMTSQEAIVRHLHFLEPDSPNLVAYTLSDYANGDAWKRILVVFNGNKTRQTIRIPEGNWKVALDGEGINEEGLRTITSNMLTIPGIAAMVLFEH